MTREEEIKQQADKYIGHSEYLGEDINTIIERIAFIEGAKWADANPNKKLVYTKKELLDMGFGFDLNGNISTIQEIEERTKKYIKYRKDKWIEKTCEYLYLTLRQSYDEVVVYMVVSKDSCFLEEFIEDLKKYMENLK